MSVYRLKGTAGAVINQSFPLTGRLAIGTGPECDVRIGANGGDALAVDVRVLEEGRVTFFCPFEQSGVTVNGVARVSGSLSPGDELRVGSCAFLLQAPGLRPERVLAVEGARPKRNYWLWVAGAGIAALLVLLAWQRGWLA